MSILPHAFPLAAAGEGPTYYTDASWDVASIDEDGSQTATFTITADPTFVPVNTTVGVALTGTNITLSDISGVANLTPTVTINASGVGSFTITANADLTLEGQESIVATLYSADSNGYPTESLSDILILNDTSKPGYSGSFDVASITENGSDTATYNLVATGVPDNTTVGYTLSGTNVTAGDISIALTGTFTVSSQAASISFTANPDFTLENTETVQIVLDSTDSEGNAVDAGLTTDTVDIVDSSIPTYQTVFTTTYNNDAGIRENNSDAATFTVTTQGVPNNTTVDYTISGVGVTVGDISLTSLTGTLTISGGTAAVGPFTANADGNSEGDETLTITLAGADSLGNSTGNLANRSKSIIIYDTSGTAQYTSGVVSTTSITENESDTCVYTITGSALTNGTLDVTLSGTNITVGDLLTSTNGVSYAQPASLTIAVPITGNSGQLFIRAQADLTNEGTETLLIDTASSDSNGVTTGLPLTQRAVGIIDSSTLVGTYDSAAFTSTVLIEETRNYTDLGGDDWHYDNMAAFQIQGTNIPNASTVPFTITGTSSTSDWEWHDQYGTNGHGGFPGQYTTSSSSEPWSSATSGNLTIVTNQFGSFASLIVRTLPKPGARNSEGGETFIVTLGATDSNGFSTGGLSDTLTIYEEPTYSLTDNRGASVNEGDTIDYTFTITGGPPASYIDSLTFYKRYNYSASTSPAAAAASVGDTSAGFDNTGFGDSGSNFNTSNKVHTWQNTIAADAATEGLETFLIEVRKNTASDNLASHRIFINDTSTGYSGDIPVLSNLSMFDTTGNFDAGPSGVFLRYTFRSNLNYEYETNLQGVVQMGSWLPNATMGEVGGDYEIKFTFGTPTTTGTPAVSATRGGLSAGTWYNLGSNRQVTLNLSTTSCQGQTYSVQDTIEIRKVSDNTKNDSCFANMSSDFQDYGGFTCLTNDMIVKECNRGFIRVYDIEIGDLILGNDGYIEVLDVVKDHPREGYWILDGWLEITNDHPIWLENKWINPEDYTGNKEYKQIAVDTVYIETKGEKYKVFNPTRNEFILVSGEYKEKLLQRL